MNDVIGQFLSGINILLHYFDKTMPFNELFKAIEESKSFLFGTLFAVSEATLSFVLRKARNQRGVIGLNIRRLCTAKCRIYKGLRLGGKHVIDGAFRREEQTETEIRDVVDEENRTQRKPLLGLRQCRNGSKQI